VKHRTVYAMGFAAGVLTGSRLGRRPYDWTVQALRAVASAPDRMGVAWKRLGDLRDTVEARRERVRFEVAMDEHRVEGRAEGRPPEEAASADPQAQAAAILSDSERRMAERIRAAR
jgi:hypothetical protein